jgi:outer membrane protein assembly factor BamE (lipoprotein component of BamABCDE complex)
MQKRLSNVLVFLLIAALMGCISVGHKIDQTAADRIVKGQTTRTEVLQLLGSPDNITRTSRGDTIFLYNYMRTTPKPATFIPLVGVFAGGANVQHQMYMVTFGSNGVVKDYISTYGASQADAGVTAAGRASMPDIESDKRPK